MHILGLIPARGGSKGVPRKNSKPLNGKPLLCYSIEAGLACSAIDRVLVSTDDEEMARISREAGAEVPFLRPAELANDQSPTIDTVVHALRFFEGQGVVFDAVCLLQPTVPFRSAEDLAEAIRKFEASSADSLISVREVPHIYNPHWVYEQDRESGLLRPAIEGKKRVTRRQDLPPAYHRDGSVYLSRTSVILEQHSLYGASTVHHVMSQSPDVNIDTMDDWRAAEQMAQQAIIEKEKNI
ncbi:MAG: acylneuraminate cytidylyltransferase family protein [Bacteroidota bacterium]